MSAAKSVAIIGAGPVGLAAAAHVLERGMTPVVLKSGPEAGHAVRQWQHVQLFSPWEYNVDRAAARLLAPTRWNSPDPQVYPTGGELLAQYLVPLATRTRLKDVIRTSSRVTAVSRVGFDKARTRGREAAPFEIRYQNGKGRETLRAEAVIDASGTWASPNPAGANGLPAIGEREAQARIAYGMPDVLGRDRERYAGKIVAVLGAGHSAIGTLTELATLARQVPGTRPIWLLRGNDPAKAFGGGANDKLAARGELGTHFASLVASGEVQVEAEFSVSAISPSDGRLRIATSSACCGRSVVADELVIATGFRPDLSFLGENSAPARSCDRGARRARTADRSQRALLRHRAPAWRARTAAGRSWLLPRRHEILRPGANLPHDHRLRTGALDRCRYRRRQGSGRARRTRAPRNRRLHTRRRGGRYRRIRLLRRAGTRRHRRLLLRRCDREGRRQARLRLLRPPA